MKFKPRNICPKQICICHWFILNMDAHIFGYRTRAKSIIVIYSLTKVYFCGRQLMNTWRCLGIEKGKRKYLNTLDATTSIWAIYFLRCWCCSLPHRQFPWIPHQHSMGKRWITVALVPTISNGPSDAQLNALDGVTWLSGHWWSLIAKRVAESSTHPNMQKEKVHN